MREPVPADERRRRDAVPAPNAPSGTPREAIRRDDGRARRSVATLCSAGASIRDDGVGQASSGSTTPPTRRRHRL